MSTFREALDEEMKWTKTDNGEDALSTTGSYCLDFFATSGSMRGADVTKKITAFNRAWNEDPLTALKLLFYTRDIRGGYGERDTFNEILAYLADKHPETVSKNLWAILEFGRASDLYTLISTKAENDMWKFMKNQFELDYENMKQDKSVSLLAKWIKSPKASSKKTTSIGRLTLKKLGYEHNRNEYRHKLVELRHYLDIPEIKMCQGKWSEIEYAKVPSRCMFRYNKAFAKHDTERYNKYLADVNNGNQKMNMGAVTPCDIMAEALKIAFDNAPKYNWDSIETMWKSLPDTVIGNAVVMADTSGSMTHGSASIPPIAVAIALATYISQRNKGDLKDVYMSFNANPRWHNIDFESLRDTVMYMLKDKTWGNNTNIEAAFDLVLKTLINGKVSPEDAPKALIIISDMQFDECNGLYSTKNDFEKDEYGNFKLTFTAKMQEKFKKAGYELPQLIYWNVDSKTTAFHAAKSDSGVTLVSGFSVNVLTQVFENIGKSPYEAMMATISSERYSKIEL